MPQDRAVVVVEQLMLNIFLVTGAKFQQEMKFWNKKT